MGQLVYDGDCGFCTTTALWAGRWLPADTEIIAWQSIDLDSINLSVDDVSTAAYWVEPGRSFRGHEAVGMALAAASANGELGWLGRASCRIGAILALAPPTSWLAAGAYRLVANNRHRLPGSTKSCRIDP